MSHAFTAGRGQHSARRQRQRQRRAVLFAILLAITSASARASDYHVHPSGANGAFRTVQAVVDAVSGATEWNRANILIAPAVYREQVTVTKPYVSLIGRGASAAATTVTFDSTHVFSGTWGEVMGIARSATAFMAHNLTIENSTPDRNRHAAVAVRCAADRAVFENVRFLGYQDTLLVEGAVRHYFRRCFVTGDTDFIFGDATAVFDRCIIESTDSGYITAASTRRATANGLIFLDSTLVRGRDRDSLTDDGTTAPNGSVFLGRPWRWYEPELMPSVVFIRTRMGTQINAAGWDPWYDTGVPGVNRFTDRDPRTRVSEFGSMDLSGRPLPDANGDGTPDSRVKWADVMTAQQAANYTLGNIFGPPQFWNSSTQPETSGVGYISQGAAWDPLAQMSRLPIPAPPVPSRAVNLSTRLRVRSGDNVVINGFIVTGDAPKKVILRALGPSLAAAGFSDVLNDPVLELRSTDGSLLASNDNWQEDAAEREAIAATGVPPPNGSESAIATTLGPGNYTMIVAGKGGASGISLSEVYDLDAESSASSLANLSTRGFVDTGDDVIIAGFILGGNNAGARVLVRALGPSMSNAGVANVMADPMLQLHNSNGMLVALNNNWKDEDEASISTTGIPPTDPREAAILATVPQDNYTAIVRGAGGSVGVALVEIYMVR